MQRKKVVVQKNLYNGDNVKVAKDKIAVMSYKKVHDNKKLNILAIRKMCKENYMSAYNNEKDTFEYLNDIYNKANKSLKKEKTLF